MMRLFIYVIAGMLCFDLHAQLMPFKNYGIKDGLNDNNVQAVIRDDRGMLWVGTDFGIYWFDGKRFFQHQVRSNVGQFYVNDFYKDRNGTIWILTYFNGVYKYKDGRFINYLPDTLLKNIPANSASNMVQVSDNKYVAICDGIPYLFDGFFFTVLDPSNVLLRSKTNFTTLLPDSAILISSDLGIFKYRFRNGRCAFEDHFLKDRHVSKILVSGTRFWVATTNGLMVFENDNTQRFSKPTAIYLSGKEVKDIIADKKGRVWILADTIFRIENNKIAHYTPGNGSPEYIHRIYSDNDGLVWFATRKGISMLGDEFYEFTPIRNGKQDVAIGAINTDLENNLWIGTDDGFALKKELSCTFFRKVGRDTIGFVACLYKNKNGMLLAGTDAGLLSIDEHAIKRLSGIHITAITENESGRKWMGDIKGNLWEYDGQKLRPLYTYHTIAEMISCLYATNETLWVGYRGAGIKKYKLSGDSLLLLKEYTATSGFNDLRIRCSATDHSGNIIFGTRTNGLFVFSVTTDSLVAHITTQNGLSANWIKGIMCDTDGKLYLATNNGINVLSGDYRHPLVKQLNIDNENIDKEANYITKTTGGFYIGTNQGILKWMPENMQKDTLPPPVYFTRIDIQGRKNFSIEPYTENGGEISLPYEQHMISFEFAGIGLKDPENVRYQYMLEGQNSEWSPLTGYNYVSYNLKPGNYTFKVIAKNADGVASRRAAIFHFVINPPFWSTWWFITLVVAAAVLLVYGAYRYKLDQVLALEQLRNKISTDLHDDIGSTLSSISILSDMALNESSDTQVMEMIKSISENSTSLLEKMDDIVWSINPKKDTLEELMVRMKRFAAALLEAKNIEYTIDVSPSVRNIKLSMEYRQHIYLILKEIINNLVKYADCSKAAIAVLYDHNQLEIMVTDNGVGFDMNALRTGNGIINMQQRAKQMNADVIITSGAGEGTKIRIIVKIK